MERFQFYIDGTQITEPKGWTDFEIAAQRDYSNRVFALKMPLILSFVGTGYSTLIDLLNENGRGYIASFEAKELLDGGYVTAFTGTIRLAEGVIDSTYRSWEVDVRDNNYSAYIFGNLELEIDVTLSESKNGTAITPPTPFDLTVEQAGRKSYVDNRGFAGFTVKAYDLMDVLNYAVAYLSDGALDFSSSFYDGLDNDEKIALISGGEAVLQNESPLIVTLDDILKSVGYAYNLYLGFGDGGLILEPESYWYNTTTGIEIESHTNPERRYQLNEDYGVIKFGDSSVTTENGALDFSVEPQLFGAYQAYLSDQGTTRNTLDIRPAYVTNGTALSRVYHKKLQEVSYTAHGVSQAIGRRGNDEVEYNTWLDAGWFDTDLASKNFVIEYNTSNNTATRVTTSEGNHYLHNPSFTNEAIIARYSFGGDLLYQPSTGGSFKVTPKSGGASWVNVNFGSGAVVDFEDVNSGFIGTIQGGRYLGGFNSVTYTAPAAETKLFSLGVYFPRWIDADVYDVPASSFVVNRQSQIPLRANVEAVKTGTLHYSTNTTTLFLDAPLYSEVGDTLYVQFHGDDNADDFENYTGSYEIMDIDNSGNTVEIDLDTSSNTYDFEGGFVMPTDTKAYIDLGATDITLSMNRFDSSDALVETKTETFSSIKTDTAYISKQTFDLDSGDYVTTKLEVSPTTTTSCTIQYIPLMWADELLEQEVFFAASPGTYKGETIEVEANLTTEQRRAFLSEPHKAISLPGGKGWIRNISINAVTGKAEIQLATDLNNFPL